MRWIGQIIKEWGLPWIPGAFSLGIGNTNTTGSNAKGVPLWGILAGDHTKAYYKDENSMQFLNRKMVL